jgi:hypothetical protein
VNAGNRRNIPVCRWPTYPAFEATVSASVQFSGYTVYYRSIFDTVRDLLHDENAWQTRTGDLCHGVLTNSDCPSSNRSRAMLIRHYWQVTVFGILLSGCESGFDAFLELSYKSMIYPDGIVACETAAGISEIQDGWR